MPRSWSCVSAPSPPRPVYRWSALKRGPGRTRIPFTVPEVRRVVLALREPNEKRAFRLVWSDWRSAHQAEAARCHAARRPGVQRVRPVTNPSSRAVVPAALVPMILSDAAWDRIRLLLPSQKPATGRPRHDHRLVLSGILAVVLTGASWREMPAEYGKWETAYKRYRLWCDEGHWSHILEALDLPATARPPP